MIYMELQADDGSKKKLLILETVNLEAIKAGSPAVSPDGSVMVSWTPDPVWLADKLTEAIRNGGGGEAVSKLLDESAKRPQKPSPRPYHRPFDLVKGETL